MDSGFVVKEIQKNFVRLVRGNEELVLDLVFGDTASSIRNIKEVGLQAQTQREVDKRSSDRVMTREQMMKAMKASAEPSTKSDAVKVEIERVREEDKKPVEQIKAEKQEVGRRLDALRRKLSLQR